MIGRQAPERGHGGAEPLAFVQSPDEQELRPPAEICRLGVREPTDVGAVRHDLERSADARGRGAFRHPRDRDADDDAPRHPSDQRRRRVVEPRPLGTGVVHMDVLGANGSCT